MTVVARIQPVEVLVTGPSRTFVTLRITRARLMRRRTPRHPPRRTMRNA